MVCRDIPRRLWDYGLVHEAEIMSWTARGLDGRTGMEQITGETSDISEFTEFGIKDLIWFLGQARSRGEPQTGMVARSGTLSWE